MLSISRFNSSLLQNLSQNLSQKLSLSMGGFAKPAMALMLTIVMTPMLASSASAQSSLELYQNRISALEDGLKNVNRLIEEDFRELKQALQNGGAGSAADVAELNNKISKLVDQMSSLSNRIERTLEVASDNEFRLLRMEKRLDSLMRMGIDGNLAVTNTPEGPAANSGSGEVPSASLNSNSNNASGWTIEASKLDEELNNLPNQDDVNQVDEAAVESEEEAPSKPSVLPDAAPDEQYRFALGKALQNDLVMAEVALNEFVQFNPEHERTNDATFWLGRVQFMKGSYEQAAMTFTEFNTNWPTDSRREKTTLWIAESISYFAPTTEVCDLLTSLPNLIEDPTDNFYDRLEKLKLKSECAG